MRRALLAIALAAVTVAAAQAQIWIMSPANQSGGGKPTPLAPCTSTGVFNLSNTCNDIYFIGALK